MALRNQAESPQQAQPGDTLIVIHAFEARSPDELSLLKGERIELVEKDDDFGDGWYLGRHMTDGRTGLFPEVYTKLAPPPPPGPNAVRSQRSGSAPTAAPSLPPPPTIVASPAVTSAGPPADGADPHSRAVNGSHAPYPQHYETSPPPLNTSGTTQRTVSVPNSAYASPTISSAPPQQRSISLMMEGARRIEDGSPVLNETLSVIDEHITDMNSPRPGLFPPDGRPYNDSGSDFSGRPVHRLSYINGNETDEDERNAHSVAEVNRWSPAQVAEFLEDIGIERQHCDVFREQEITGEVLLNLDQASVFMKEFDLGVVGRRLRTWQKIKSFQDEVRATSRSSMGKRTSHGQAPEGNAQALHSAGTGPRHLRQSSPLSESYIPDVNKGAIREPSLPTMPESPHRSPTALSPTTQERGGLPPDGAASPSTHNKKPSLDRNWTMSSGGGGSPAPNRSSFLGLTSRSRGGSTIDFETGSDGTRDLDRGYLSGSEADSRKYRNVLRKRDAATTSVSHSRQSSYKGPEPTANKRHSRFGSAGSFIASLTGGRSQDDNAIPHFGSDGKEPTTMIGGSPVVTRLEYDSPRNTVVSRKHESQHVESSRSSLSQAAAGKVPDEVSRAEKASSLSSTLAPSPMRESTGKDASVKSPARTTSTTETSKSIEFDQSKARAAISGLTPTSGNRKPKNKKQTSAYTRGLLKITPREAMADCDYSGWMKKKSPSLIATWKPRLFVLRGRRLSYYYNENDKEEQGLIDISSHKVLPADDLLTGIHATVTGAKSSPTSPANAQTETMNAAEVAAQADSALKSPFVHESIFIFKLVPPRAGLSRAVNFTKPTVHYFAVDNIRQGRLWMAALMKATIQMDSTKPMVTTYGQKTISLAKAQQMRQRPPALQDADEPAEHTLHEDDESNRPGEGSNDDTGLKIQGLDMSYEYLPSSQHAGSTGNGKSEVEGEEEEEEEGGGPTSAPLLSHSQAASNNAAARGGRATASYQEGRDSLRLVRSLSGGLSHHSHKDEEEGRARNDLYNDYISRPSTSASKQSHASRMRAASTNTGDTGSAPRTTTSQAD